MGWNLRLDSASGCCHRVVARLGRVLAAYRRAARLALGRGPCRRRYLRACCFRVFDPATMFQGGIGGGAIGVPLYGMAGGYALSGRGPRWARISCGLLFATMISIWALDCSGLWWAGSGGNRAAWRLGGLCTTGLS